MAAYSADHLLCLKAALAFAPTPAWLSGNENTNAVCMATATDLNASSVATRCE
jgi:hypothetical protein